jgi:hypothetical protein
MREKPKAMLFASLAADSLALGVHWIYNTNVIDKKFGRVETVPDLIWMISHNAGGPCLKTMMDILITPPNVPLKTSNPENHHRRRGRNLMIWQAHPGLHRSYMFIGMILKN